MAGKRVRFARQADEYLNGLLRYIAEHSGSSRAHAIEARLRERLALLASRPRIGRPAPDFGPDARSSTMQPWIIYYRPLLDGDGVQIVRIVDSRRDLDRLFRQKP